MDMADKSKNAVSLVSGAILGIDSETVIVNGRAYVIKPPMIKRIAGAGMCLSHFMDGADSFGTMMKAVSSQAAARALSWMIAGDESLTDELSEGTLDEVTGGLEAAYGLVSVVNFSRLSTLARSVAGLIARRRQ